MEEFYESEIMWPEINSDRRRKQATHIVSTTLALNKSTKLNHRTDAINIPIKWQGSLHEYNIDDDELISGNSEVIPPHILAERRRKTEKMAFSLCSGQGRTLKGRDLKHVRNAVLRMTGYLEG
ncbi:uncharacterized protein LOC120259437 [Dioscorea cayenensis subsp. rotundata]|uniref:Uncharacterized protein LOC120259437 n=1 Tax=Dioscorea cayennensis subsp. rotundata TaxID=55577 RepID=A0AB40B8G3_DIOCR|nr:uncharacterized protein LOC120259437 [Dioscorea cayenensis subsp. rotundata]